jgi:glycine cleavage system H protein
MAYPSELKYTKDHEWVRLDGDTAEIGVTDYAQQQLGDVVFVELPEAGRALKAGEAFGNIESVKAVSELFAPVGGEVVEVNTALVESPDRINSHPHDSWMLKVCVADPAEAAALLDAAQYESLIK